jgi:ribose transport system permease protein
MNQSLGPPAAIDPPTGRSRIRADQIRQLVAPFAIFTALLVLIAVMVPQFLGGGGPSIIAQQATPILLVALGQSVVLLVGSIDLSIASQALLTAILSAMTLGPLGAASPALCVGISTLIGVANGLLLVTTQIPSFALTLGTLGVLQAAALVVTGQNVVYVKSHLEVVSWLFQVSFLTLPAAFWLSVAFAVLLWALLRFTGAGQALTAVGFNERASILSGLRVRLAKVTAFGLSGFFAGLAGVSVIGIGGAASSIGLGSDLLLPGIAASIAGGTAITGGVCNPINVVFGSMFIALIPVGTAAIGVPTQAQNIFYGLVLIVAVAATMSRSRSGIVK